MIRSKETLLAPFVNHFILAEKSYRKEIGFVRRRYTILENKYKPLMQETTSFTKPKDRIRLLFSGTISETYGIFSTIDFVKKLHKYNRNFELLIIGYCATMAELKHIKSQNGFKGYVTPYDAYLLIRYQDKNKVDQTTRLYLKLPDPIWAGLWGVCVLLLFFVLIGLLKPQAISKEDDVFERDESKDDWEKTNKLKRLLLYPLNFAVTPLGSYSISLTQILFWTFITIFGLVYVHRISEEFLVITPQVLMLLGIGGGAALGAKMNARSNVFDIPSYYLKFVTKKRIPKLKDIISIGGQPNIFKFQMLAFTLITGCYVVVDIIKNYAFPEIPENIIIMMGISSLIYLGNEVTIKSVWDQIKEQKKEIDAYEPFQKLSDKTKERINELANKDSEFKRMFEEMKRLLNSIYA